LDLEIDSVSERQDIWLHRDAILILRQFLRSKASGK
jgi:hypothetical protein